MGSTVQKHQSDPVSGPEDVCVCVCLGAVGDEGEKEERSQDGEEEQSGAAGEQIVLQGRVQNAVVR